MIDAIQQDNPDAHIIQELAPLRSDAEREASKPDISRLPNALDADGHPLFRAGEKIIIERRSTVLKGNPYLDTRTYLVLGVDRDNGNLDLFDENLAQSALSNYISGSRAGFVFKLARGNDVATKKKRGRPRKNPIVDETEQKPTDADGQPTKKKRGRPPGSKNRDRDTIKAEKKAKMSQRAERKAKRKAKP